MKKLIMLLLLISSYSGLFAKFKNDIKIEGKADFLKNGDTVKLTIYRDALINTEKLLQEVIYAKVSKNAYTFDFSSKLIPNYITIEFRGNPQFNLYEYVVLKGDDININCTHGKTLIAGNNCNGFSLQYNIKQIAAHFNISQRHPHFNSVNLSKVFFNYDSIANRQQEVLASNKFKIADDLYNLLAADIKFSAQYYKYYDAYFVTRQYNDTSSNPISRVFKAYMKHAKPPLQAPGGEVWRSNYYVKFLTEQYKVSYCFEHNGSFNLPDALSDLSRKFSGHLRDQILMNLICETSNYPKSLTTEIGKISVDIGNPDFQNYLNAILKRADSEMAFNFSLTDMNGKEVKLSDFKGKVVLLDFWFTGCVNCRMLAPVLKAVEQNFSKDSVEFVGISIDKNVKTWIASIKNGQYVSEKNLNLFTNGQGDQNPVINKYKIKGYPSLVLITKRGTLFNIDTDPRSDNGRKLSSLLKSAQNDAL